MHYPLPKTTANIITQLQKSPSKQQNFGNSKQQNFSNSRSSSDLWISNFGLLFHKFIHYNNNSWKRSGEEKTKAWENLNSELAKLFTETSQLSNLLRGLHSRLDLVLLACGMKGYTLLNELPSQETSPYLLNNSIKLKVDWRLSIGFGTASVLETGITLNRVYGIPYIPSSSIKGILRHYWLSDIGEKLGIVALDPSKIRLRQKEKILFGKTPMQVLEELITASKLSKDLSKLFNKLCQDQDIIDTPEGNIKTKQVSLEELYEANKNFRLVFGGLKDKGAAIFFDAFPETLSIRGKPILSLDIINPHYQDYYSSIAAKRLLEEKKQDHGANSKQETTNIIPPADYLKPNPIQFLTFSTNTPILFRFAAKNPSLLKDINRYFLEFSQNIGLGAKTFSGYGLMKEEHPNP